MICPNCQAKFNGFRMGKDREQHLIKCGNCNIVLVPTDNSFSAVKKKNSINLFIIGLSYVVVLFLANQYMKELSDWIFYLLMAIGAIIGSKIYVMLYKKHYEQFIQFQAYDVRQSQKCDIDL